MELKHTVEILNEEQVRIVKIEAIKKSLEVEVKVKWEIRDPSFPYLLINLHAWLQNLSVRLEEVEANAVVGARRAISKLESRVRDMETELDLEKRNHSETIKILRKKERTVKEIIIQCEEDQKNVLLLQEQLDKANSRLQQYKRQLSEQVKIVILSFQMSLLTNSLYFRRVSRFNLFQRFAGHNASWKQPKNALMSLKAAWTWFALSTALSSPHQQFPEVKSTWSQKLSHADHPLKETKPRNEHHETNSKRRRFMEGEV